MRKVRDSTYPIPCRIVSLTSADFASHSQAETPYGGGDCTAESAPMAKGTPPIKRDMLPVIDPQLRICSSKVPPSSKVLPHLSMFYLRAA